MCNKITVTDPFPAKSLLATLENETDPFQAKSLELAILENETDPAFPAGSFPQSARSVSSWRWRSTRTPLLM